MDQAVIRRKLAGARVADVAGGAEKAWPLALARAARDLMGATLDVTSLQANRQSLTEVLELPPERAMIAMLEGPRDSLGVLMMAPEVMSALIEAQTLGRISPQPVLPRKPTRTDAAMVAGFLDTALAGLETALLADEDLVWTDGFRYASHLEDPRPLGLLLEDAPFKVLTLECLLGGVKSGRMVLALPADGRGRRPHRSKVAVPEPAAELVFTAALQEQVMVAECQLQAVLARATVPLARVLGLQIGDILPLPLASIDRLDLEGLDGRNLSTGKLGQHRGMRAIRLTADVEAARPTLSVVATAPAMPKTGTG